MGATGGFARAEPRPPAAALGDEIRVPQFAVTFLDAEVADEVEEVLLEADPGETVLVLSARIENLTDRAFGMSTTVDRVDARLITSTETMFALVGAEPLRTERAWRPGDDSTAPVVLQPRVPTEVRIAWVVADDAFSDGTAELDIYTPAPMTGRIIVSADYETWRRGDLAARLTVEVGS